MEWDIVGKKLAAGGLRVLGGALAGPAGATVGSLVSDALGLDTGSPEEAMQHVAQNPEALLKLKELEHSHRERLQELALEAEAVYIRDRASARQREVEVSKATGKMNKHLYVLSWFIVTGFFSLVGLLLFHEIPTGQSDVLFMLFGSVSSGFGAVLQYFFGSSRGSKEKTDALLGAKKDSPKN